MTKTSFSETLLRITRATIAGMKVMDRMKAATRASIRVMAMGEKVLPSTPWKVSRGAKTSRMMAWP